MNETATFWVAVGGAFCAILLVFSCKLSRGWHFLTSIALIGLSVLMAYGFSQMISTIDNAKMLSGAQRLAAEKEKFAASFWLAIFPAVFGGIGINLLSYHLTPPE